MVTTRIFLASSSELKTERDEFRNFLAVENDRLHKQGVYLELVQWEHFLDSISHSSKQADYNEALKKCDIVVSLFHTKAGKYTQEEFKTAYDLFKSTGKPIIYTYFKSGSSVPANEDEAAQSLVTFKKRLYEIGHFYTVFENMGDLKYHFLKQLEMLSDKGLIRMREEVVKSHEDRMEDEIEKLERQGVKRQLELFIRRLNRIREALAVETDPSLQFKYEVRIEDMEKQILSLKKNIGR